MAESSVGEERENSGVVNRHSYSGAFDGVRKEFQHVTLQVRAVLHRIHQI